MKTLITFSLLLFFAANNFAQDTFPKTAAGKRADSFLKMLNSTTDADLQNFLKNEMTPNRDISAEERLQMFQNIRNDLRDAKLEKLIESGDDLISFAISTKSGKFLQINLEIAPNSENRISGIGIEMAPQGRSTQAAENFKKVSAPELVPAVEKYLDELSKSDEFSGAVLIAKDGKPVFQNAYGFASKEFKVPNRTDTKFNIGSLNKMFTALAVAVLADEGKLSFADTIGKHLPDYPNKDAAKKATIYHLLTMSSGIGDFFGEEYDSLAKDKIRTISDYLPLFASKPLDFEPGTSQQYSNGGFLVLGAIIEKVSGKSYYDLVREKIFQPLGMKDTASYAMDEVVENMAQGYTLGEFGQAKGERKNNIYTLPLRGSSAGGGYSTVNDLLKFVNAIDSGKLPVPESFKKSKGIMDADMLLRGFRAAGGSMGVNSIVFSKLPQNYTVIVLSNYDPPSAEKVGKSISQMIGRN